MYLRNDNCCHAYPTISQTFHDWIKSIRRTYPELRHESLEPHFTLVFPISDSLSLRTFQENIQSISQKIRAINFTIRCTIPMPSRSDDHYVFLVPDEGFSQVIALHDVLYSGIFAKYLRLDIPYIPHITIGYTQNLESVHKICKSINRETFNFDGVINALELVQHNDSSWHHIHSFELSG